MWGQTDAAVVLHMQQACGCSDFINGADGQVSPPAQGTRRLFLILQRVSRSGFVLYKGVFVELHTGQGLGSLRFTQLTGASW